MVDNQHQKIKGYRDLSEKEIALMNSIKETAESVKELINYLHSTDNTENLQLDKRWLAIGTTDLQTGFMALVRAVAQPTTF